VALVALVASHQYQKSELLAPVWRAPEADLIFKKPLFSALGGAPGACTGPPEEMVALIFLSKWPPALGG
jgi:hypothetical protein